MNKDIVWIDYAKMIGIWLVVFCHSMQRIPGWAISHLPILWNYIYLFHMPLFFVISGYLYSNNKNKTENNLRLSSLGRPVGGGKILKGLLLPYLIYQMAYLPFAIWVNRKGIFCEGQFVKLLVGFVGGDGYETPISYYICLPCWFIMCIIQLRLLFLFIDINKVTSLFLFALSLCFLILRDYFQMDFYFCIDSTIMAIPYFLLGHYMKKKSVAELPVNWKLKCLIALLSAFLLYIILECNGEAQMNGPSYGKNVFINYIAGVLGSLMIFQISQMLCKMWGKRVWITLISRNTLFIIFSHWIILLPITILLDRLMKCDNDIIILLCSILISFFVVELSKKWISVWGEKYPVLFGKLK